MTLNFFLRVVGGGGGWSLAGGPFSFGLKRFLGKRSATVRACPQILYYLGLASVY